MKTKRLPDFALALNLALALAVFFLVSVASASAADLAFSRIESFDDNSGQWPTVETGDRVVQISGGSYRITDKKAGLNLNQLFPIQRDRDYSLEAVMRSDASSDDSFWGLIWDYKDKDNYLRVILANGKRFAVSKTEGGKASLIVPWTIIPSMSAKGNNNIIGVRRQGSTLRFSINGAEVKSIPYVSVSGTHIGFTFNQPQTLTVDSLSLYETRQPSGLRLTRPRELSAADELKFGSIQAWMGGFGIGGLSASFHSASEKEGPGWIFTHWNRTSVDASATARQIDLLGDFSIEAELELLSGDPVGEYGLALDVLGEDFLFFGISPHGYVSISRFSKGKKMEILAQTRSDAIVRYETVNSLNVQRWGSRLLFAINGFLVHEIPYSAWNSTKLGFAAAGFLRFKLSLISIYQRPAAEVPILGSCADGWGIKRLADGSVYSGFWKSGLPEGSGTRYAKSGAVSEGRWKAGKFEGFDTRSGPPIFPIAEADGKNRGFIDASGKLLARVSGNLAAFGQSAEGPAPASAQWGFVSTYSEGYALVSKPGSETTGPYGVLDASGRLVLEPGLLDIDPDWGIQSGLVVIRGTGGATTGGPTTGETTTGGGASGTKGGVSGTAGGPFYGLASVDGLVLREPDLLEIGLFAEGFAPAMGSNGLWGFMDKTGIWRVAPEYDEVGYFSEGLAYARMDGNIPLELFLDTTGSHKFLLISNHPLVPYRFSEGLSACSAEGNKIVFIDRSGKPAFPAAPWKDALPFSEGLAAVRDSDGWKFIDKNGSVAIPGPFEKLMPFSGGLAAAKRGSSWGYIDSSGSWIIQPAFADAWPFGPEGLAQVRLSSGALGWIDKKGNPIWIPAEPAKASQEAAAPQGATPPQAAPAKPVLPPQAATRQKAWKEDFSSNAAGWPLGTSETAEYKLSAGRYRLAGKTDAGALALVPLDFDRSADYSLSATLRHDSGGADDSMGLVWEADSAGRHLVFALSPDGAYAVLDVLPEATNLYVPWTAHKAIKPGPSDNRLEVRRRGQKLEFWINGTMVKSLPHFGISGTGVGFICFYANAISVDDLILGK